MTWVSSRMLTALKKNNSDMIWLEFTGMIDARGNRIFEGDIVESSIDGVKFRGFMQYNNTEYRWGTVAFISQKDYQGPTRVEAHQAPTIIGNVYENPELLEDEEEKKPNRKRTHGK